MTKRRGGASALDVDELAIGSEKVTELYRIAAFDANELSMGANCSDGFGGQRVVVVLFDAQGRGRKLEVCVREAFYEANDLLVERLTDAKPLTSTEHGEMAVDASVVDEAGKDGPTPAGNAACSINRFNMDTDIFSALEIF